jgi:hypothetical protein
MRTTATDRRRVEKAAREVWKRLDREERARALAGKSRARSLSYRLPRPKRGARPAPFIPRDAYLSQVQAAVAARLAEKRAGESGARIPAVAKPDPDTDQLFDRFGPDDWGWITTVVQKALTLFDVHPFGETPAEQRMGDRVRLVIFADWATGSPRAQRLADMVGGRLGDRDLERHLIHLGDVYYAGLPSEYRERFLRYWPAPGDDDRLHSWNLNGNHDMYSGGHGYFELVSGIGDPPSDGANSGSFAHQRGTSCFRIYNDHWQVIALDTAYVDNDLADAQLPWLERWMGLDGSASDPAAASRKTILLSHHQLGSAHSQAAVGPGIREKTRRVRETGRVHAWIWGHEHRAFVYEPYLGVQCPVCIGNGGVPELLTRIFTFEGLFQSITGTVSKLKALLFGPRVRPPRVAYEPTAPEVDPDGLKWEQLGFVVIDLDGPDGHAVYVGEENPNDVPIEGFG